MPLYAYKCGVCGHEEDGYNTVEQRKTLAPECHGRMEIKVVPTNIAPDIKEFMIPGTSTMIGSRSKKREYMRQNGLTEVGNEGRPERNEE